MLHNIPPELVALNQWVVAADDKIPLTPLTLLKASPTDPLTWGTYAQAVAAQCRHIGFVLHKDDPYCIIDLDAPTSPEQAARHSAIYNAFETYAEVSQSGHGLHIVCRGAVPHGVRRDKVEIYSEGRYIIFTGNVCKALPIIECQALLTPMFEQMAVGDATPATLVQIDGSLTDEQVYRMGAAAANAEKFNQLWAGQWHGDPLYPSQSEADFALLSMLCFYTKDNEQVRRIFRYSALGQRAKAIKNDKYINFALGKIRGQELPAIDLTKLLVPGNAPATPWSEEAGEEGGTGRSAAGHESNLEEGATGLHAAVDAGPTDKGSSINPAPYIPEAPDSGQASIPPAPPPIPFPPGLIGRLAQFFLDSAIRPVPEIALVSSIAFVAGIAGRCYNISDMGLNQYLILLARTGSGKEGAATSIDSIVAAVRHKVPLVDEFMGPGVFASGQALIRVLDKQPCFVSVLGEFGFTLQAMCDPKANAALAMLKRAMLDIYAKSGHRKSIKPSVYSDAEKNTRLVQSPNFSFLGESTPEAFYDGLDSSAIAQGLIPRLGIFEYLGPRPPRNPNAFCPPPEALVEEVVALLYICLSARENRAVCKVNIDAEAKAMLDSFDREADAAINSAHADAAMQLWNRAHLKALKLAALIAVGRAPHAPLVEREDAEWAMNLVRRDIKALLSRFMAGDIGMGDQRMESDLRRAVEDYLATGPRKRMEYQVPERMSRAPVIPLGYLRRRLRSLQSFKSDKRGANAALSAILKSMCEAGELQLMNPLQAKSDFDVNSPIYVLGPGWPGAVSSGQAATGKEGK